jgi:hypothetical protein
MTNVRALEVRVDPSGSGRARLEIDTEDRRGGRFTIEVEGPEPEVRAEAAFLAGQYHLLPH